VRAPPPRRPSLVIAVEAGDPLVRASLVDVLRSSGRFLRVSPRAGEEREAPASEIACLVWDAGLDPTAALDGLRCRSGDAPPVLLLIAEPESAVTALLAGARGAVLRDAPSTALAAAAEAVALGLSVTEPTALASLPATGAGGEPLLGPLTEREREVLALLAEGLSNRAIASRLAISEHTAKFHVTQVMGKLGAQKRVEAVVRAARLGVLSL
jgi:two-component system, NarL family, nitrate/nitrite response regulator NarL